MNVAPPPASTTVTASVVPEMSGGASGSTGAADAKSSAKSAKLRTRDPKQMKVALRPGRVAEDGHAVLVEAHGGVRRHDAWRGDRQHQGESEGQPDRAGYGRSAHRWVPFQQAGVVDEQRVGTPTP